MAAFSGTVTLVGPGAYEISDRTRKHIAVRKRISITLASQGGGTNYISATSLGFRSGGLIGAKCLLFTDGGSVKRWIALFTDGSYLYTADPTVSTDANRGAAADVTGTLVAEVDGLV
jgi:hypothetical protein